MFQTLTKLEFKLPRNEKGQSFASHLVFLYKFLKFKSETGVQPIYSLGVKIYRQRIFNFVDMFFLLQSAKTIKVTNQKITIKNNEGKILTLPRLISKMDTVHQAKWQIHKKEQQSRIKQRKRERQNKTNQKITTTSSKK